MSRDKQIEEMATKMLIEVNRAGNEISFANLATTIYNAGYRKAPDLAEKIFAEIEEMVITEKSNDGCALYLDKVELAELKKKYTEVAERREVSENNTVRCFHPSVTESQREAERREGVENSPVDCSTPNVTDQKGEGK